MNDMTLFCVENSFALETTLNHFTSWRVSMSYGIFTWSTLSIHPKNINKLTNCWICILLTSDSFQLKIQLNACVRIVLVVKFPSGQCMLWNVQEPKLPQSIRMEILIKEKQLYVKTIACIYKRTVVFPFHQTIKQVDLIACELFKSLTKYVSTHKLCETSVKLT